MENQKILRLASYAVFKELYDAKKDVYDVITKFIEALIIEKKLRKFNLTEIKNELKSKYGFNIPEAVIKTVLKKLKIKKDNIGNYIPDIRKIGKKQKAITKIKETEQENYKVIESLLNFIKEKKNLQEIGENEKEKIISSLYSFLLGEKDKTEYTDLVAAYVITIQNNPDFQKQLDTIKQGVILYSGILYTDNLNELENFKTELTIFLDMEILFHLAGYNGTLYKQLTEDFCNLVKEVNTKKKKRFINLKYFEKTKKEIDDYFYAVEQKVNKNVDPSKIAMIEILKDCHSKSDVVAKKTKFYHLMKTSYGIMEEDYRDYYNERNRKYNVDYDVKNLKKELKNEDDIEKNIDFLNFINILRKGKAETFDKTKYIFLTGTIDILKIARHKRKENDYNIPLATDLDFMTNKFWFKLNKRLGENTLPKSFSTVIQAQIILASHLSSNIHLKYEQIKNKKYNEETSKQLLADIRKKAKYPEDIKPDNVYEVSMILSQEIEDTMREQESFKQKAKETAQENTQLKNENQDKTKELEKAQEEIKNYKQMEEERQKKKNKRKKILCKTIFIFCIVLFGASLFYLNKIFEGIIITIVGGLISIFSPDIKNCIKKILK